MVSSAYHFYQRTDRHRPLDERATDVQEALKKAMFGFSKATVHVHPTHVHIFAELEKKQLKHFVKKTREEIRSVSGIRWDAEYYLTPVSSISEEYVSRLLRDLHRQMV